MPPNDRTGPAGGTGPAPDTLAVGASGDAFSLSIIPRPAGEIDGVPDEPGGTHPIQLLPENVENVAGKWVTHYTLLHAAIYYGRNGRPVFPCGPWDGAYKRRDGTDIDAKAPLVRNGWKDATTDVAQIQTWWEQFPYAMIGSPVAPDELCLDIDPRNGGDRWALVDMAGITELPITRMVLSGRYDGGHHLFYQRPPGQLTDVRLPKGIDIRVGAKHYTILPPSVHPDTGGAYLWRWSSDAPAAPLPDEVAALLVPIKIERTAFTTRAKEPTSGRLAGICRKVASTPPGNRQTIGFIWAAQILKEAGYGPAAWDAVADAMRDAGASEHDIRTALRERPRGERVNA
jgi:hypothetical protein